MEGRGEGEEGRARWVAGAQRLLCKRMLPADGCADSRSAPLGVAGTERSVHLLNLFLFELTHQPRGAARVLRKQQHARRVQIEPVHRMRRACIALPSSCARGPGRALRCVGLNVTHHAVEHASRPEAVWRRHGHPCGLRYRDDVSVFKQHLQTK
eukprot:6183121-Pleurochrysis_carterae.AAC.1